MSYILDALRKSESERNQGRVPDLGQQVQLIHKPRRRGIPVMVWVGLGLLLNAAVVALVFWPGWSMAPHQDTTTVVQPKAPTEPVAEPASRAAAPAATNPAVAAPVRPQPEPVESPVAASGDGAAAAPEAGLEKPTVIVPSWKSGPATGDAFVPEPQIASANEGRVPHLVEMPMSFQRRIPTLIFSSHVYASDPSSRRVMINDNYLRPGERFAGILVEQITVDGVVLSLDGQRFRVGVVRNWISPR